MATQSKFARSADAREAGWYSRRHETKASSDAMKAAHPYRGRRGRRGNPQ